MVISLELRRDHRVGIFCLVVEIQSRVPVVGHVWLHTMGVTGGLLRRSKVKRRREGVGSKDIVDMIAWVLARRYDRVETLTDEGRSMIQDEVGSVEIVCYSATQDHEKAQEGRMLDSSSHDGSNSIPGLVRNVEGVKATPGSRKSQVTGKVVCTKNE